MTKKIRIVVIVIVAFLVAIEILLLKPSVIHVNEKAVSKGLFKNITTLMENQKPDDEVRYTINGFHYTAVSGEKKQWEMNSDSAVLFEVSKKVVATNAKIKMFDSTGKITFIEGQKAYYVMGGKDFELENDVKVTFPDGFWIKTSKANYTGVNQVVTSSEDFFGESTKTDSEHLQVWGKGFRASSIDPDIHVLSQCRVKIHRILQKETNDVRSDIGRIDRFNKVAYFSMTSPGGFVDSDLNTLNVKSRRQEAHYDAAGHVLNFMTAFEDVTIKEMDQTKGGIKYSTCQRADFVAKDDKILLTGFPSVYQENDTVTGELITIYRSKNIVEVTQANGYHNDATQQQPTKKTN